MNIVNHKIPNSLIKKYINKWLLNNFTHYIYKYDIMNIIELMILINNKEGFNILYKRYPKITTSYINVNMEINDIHSLQLYLQYTTKFNYNFIKLKPYDNFNEHSKTIYNLYFNKNRDKYLTHMLKNNKKIDNYNLYLVIHYPKKYFILNKSKTIVYKKYYKIKKINRIVKNKIAIQHLHFII